MKISLKIILLPLLILCLSGFTTANNKSSATSIIYAATTLLSLLLLVGCVVLVRKKRKWLIMLFSSVFVVNAGYALLSVSNNLQTALWANRLSYLGSVFLPFSMLMILLNVTNTKHKKHISKVLLTVAAIIFLIAASPGFSNIYYKEVSFEVVNGVSSLVKVYGILHPIYFFYLLGYFSAMVAIIIHAQAKKTINSTAHAIVLAVAVFVNIGVWLTEQLVQINFEILSISYIISELFLLGVHLVVKENQRLRELLNQIEDVRNFSKNEVLVPEAMLKNPTQHTRFTAEQIELFIKGTEQLTPTERTIYVAYIARVTSKEIMANLNIKENTLKYHNKNIYGKLGVSSRKELIEIYKQIKSIKSNLDTAN